MKSFFIIVITLFFSCSGEEPLTPEEQKALELANAVGISYDMDDNLKLTISAQNISETIGLMNFTLLYNNITISSINSGDYTILFNSDIQGVEDDYPSFTFGEVKGTGVLLLVQFSAASKGATISTTNEQFFDTSNPPQEIFFENGMFRNVGLCYTDDLSTGSEEIILPDATWNQGTNYCID